MLIEIADVKLSLHANPILNGVRLSMRQADSGTIRVLGLDPARQRRELHHQLGVLAEDSGFYGGMNAPDYLRWMGRLYGREIPAEEAARRLAQVGLESVARKAVSGFSRGMKQRLGLARALLTDPQLLILDEPTNGLDPRGRREIHDVLLALSRDRNVGILLCTHLLDDVDRLCSRIGIINQGETLKGNLKHAI